MQLSGFCLVLHNSSARLKRAIPYPAPNVLWNYGDSNELRWNYGDSNRFPPLSFTPSSDPPSNGYADSSPACEETALSSPALVTNAPEALIQSPTNRNTQELKRTYG